MARAAKRRRSVPRALDFVIYALIAVAIYGGILWFANQGVASESVAKWYGFGLFTVVAFGQTIAQHRQSWLQSYFWVAVAGILAIHSAVFVTILIRVHDWKAIWWAVMYPIESVALNWSLFFLGFKQAGSRTRGMWPRE